MVKLKNMKTVKDFNVRDKRVLVRCDFNVPFDKKGNIAEDFRIKKSLATIKYLIGKKAKVILISHLGRPTPIFQRKIGEFIDIDFSALPTDRQFSKNKKNLGVKKNYTLKPVAQRLEKLLKKKVKFLDDCIGGKVGKQVSEMKAGEIILLENLRFYKGEENNDLNFAQELAGLGDIFIQDAFGSCHRSHASMVGVPKYLPSGIGLLVEEEIKVLKKLKDNPKKPLVIIIGGKKAKTKAKLINKISKSVNDVLIGHLIQKEIKNKKEIKIKYPHKIVEPIDGAKYKGKDLDLGPETISLFKEKILKAKTIFWNGQLGVTEEKKFVQGSLEVAKAIIKSRAFSIIGGGDTVAFLIDYNLKDKFNFISTGGGAMITFLSGDKLPGLEILK